MTTDIQEIYATALRNTRVAELQGVHTMTTVLKGLEHYPDYERVTRQHLDATHGQIARLDAALKAVGESSSTLKDTVTSVAGLVSGAAHAVAGDETLKNLYAAYAYQHEQIAAYRSLGVIAEAAGQSAQVPEVPQGRRGGGGRRRGAVRNHRDDDEDLPRPQDRRAEGG
ncbi:DUF892 family protein [Methylobacterium sp. NEAU 140]|uniref:DUF892 family protein n=1 Tax=Methylobacterium sp. NEAU 140 TaxID=3064945 RepID=UPI002736A5C2|nr:DUF892 family protein [Methylobacterium sp. NEAU 140]MDP4025343.1 DUF892 family protein [Methylobacterium sp. NEAU 140]